MEAVGVLLEEVEKKGTVAGLEAWYRAWEKSGEVVGEDAVTGAENWKLVRQAVKRRRLELELAERIGKYHIRDIHANEVMFVPKPGQWDLIKAEVRQRVAKQPVRIFNLKSRKQGTSTYVSLRLYDRLKANAGQMGAISSYNIPTADILVGMYKFAYDRDKERRENKALEKWTKDKKSSRTFTFAEGSGAGYFEVFTGYSEFVGHGYTPQNGHLDEYPLWRCPARALAGLLSAFPMQTDTIVVLSGTANGYGDDFHKMWQEKDDGWERVFMPYWSDPANSYPFQTTEEQEIFADSLTPSENAEAAKYKLTLEQLHWRRMKLNSIEFRRSPELFRQEFPGNPEEAFLSSGGRYYSFPLDKVSMAATEVREKKLFTQYDLTASGLKESEEGNLFVYVESIPGRSYVLGLDTAEGLKPGKKAGKDPDSHCMWLLDRTLWLQSNGAQPMEQVAEWTGREPVQELPAMVVALAEYFCNAWVFPERNGSGEYVAQELENMYRPRMGWRPEIVKVGYKKHEFVSFKVDNNPPQYGIRTNGPNKPLIMDILGDMIYRDQIIVRSANTIKELYSIRKNPSQGVSIGAPQSSHDDRVIAMAMAVLCAKYQPRDLRFINQDGDKRGDKWHRDLIRAQGGRAGSAVTIFGQRMTIL